MMLVRGTRRAAMSSSPRMTVAQSLLRFEAITGAETEAELQAAKSAAPAQLTATLPESLQPLSSYLNSSSVGQAPYVPDPNAWQNLPFLSFVKREARRPINIWVLLVGPAIFLYMVSAPWRNESYRDPEVAKKSLYLQQLKGLKAMALPDEHH